MSLTGKLAMMSKGLFSQGQTGAAKITEQARDSIILQGIQIAKQQKEIAEYREALESVIALQEENFGNAMVTHIKLKGRSNKLKDLLAKHNKGDSKDKPEAEFNTKHEG